MWRVIAAACLLFRYRLSHSLPGLQRQSEGAKLVRFSGIRDDLGCFFLKPQEWLGRGGRALKAISQSALSAAQTISRVQYDQIPKRFRAMTDTGRPLLDYGVCVIRF